MSDDAENFRGWVADRADEIIAESSPNDIRALGWSVAVHNDYKLGGVPHTFWLFTKGSQCVKGEGRSDADALNQVRKSLRILVGRP